VVVVLVAVLAVDADVVVPVVVTDALVVVCDFLTEVVAVDLLPVTHRRTFCISKPCFTAKNCFYRRMTAIQFNSI